MIKAELHPPHQAGRWATVRPSTLLLITWTSKNWPCVHLYGQYHVFIASAVSCVDVWRLNGAVHCRMWTYGDVLHLTSTCVHAECVDVQRRMQCERGLRTTNDSGTFIEMTVLEITIAVLHHLPIERRVGCHA